MLVLSGLPQRESVDILVVGDPSVGKTSLITTLVSSIFPENVPRVLQQVRVPPEETADHIALTITDTAGSADSTLSSDLWNQLHVADVVIVVYSMADPKSIDRVEAVWMEEILKVFKGPVVLVGNKTDLLKNEGTQVRRRCERLLDKFEQIDACWECSAKLNINVSDVFSMVQKAVVYPIAPLFNTRKRDLMPKFRTALKRVFRIFDQDRDGLLADVELNDFQETCFGARLQPSDIEDVKNMLMSEGSGLVTSFGITFEGFLSIHKKFLEKNRAETSWLVLRQFGFADDLELQVPAQALQIKELGEGSTRDRSVELTKTALTFFADLFHQFDQDKDQALSPEELSKLFEICPGGVGPWGLHAYFATSSSSSPAALHTPSSKKGTTSELKDSSSTRPSDLYKVDQVLFDLSIGPENSALCDVEDFPQNIRVDENGNISLAGWLAEWSMLTLLQPRLVLLYLYLLGFDRFKEEAVVLTRSRRIENDNNDLKRNVVRAFVFGANGVGKSTLLDALVSSPAQPPSQPMTLNHSNNTMTYSAATSEQAIEGQKQGLSPPMKVSPSAWTFASGFNNEYNDRKHLARSVAARVRSTASTSFQGMASGALDSSGGSGMSPSATKFFVLTEVSPDHDALDEAFANQMVDCDLAVLLFDSTNPSSIDWLHAIQKRIPESVPCVYLATKIDLLQDPNGNESEITSEAIEEGCALCAANSLPFPELVTLNPHATSKFRQKTSRLFELLLSAALKPDAARPISEEKRAMQRRTRMLRATLRISLVTTVVLSAGFLLWSWTRPTPGKSSSKKTPTTVRTFTTEGSFRTGSNRRYVDSAP